MKFCLLFFVMCLRLQADYSKVQKEFTEELKQLNAEVLEQRQKMFQARESMRRAIAQTAHDLKKLAQKSDEDKQQVEELLTEIDKMQRAIGKANSEVTALKSGLRPIRREVETLVPAEKHLVLAGAFARFDEGEDKLSAFNDMTEQLLADGFSMQVDDVEALNESGQKMAGRLLSLGHAVHYLVVDGYGGLAAASADHHFPTVKFIPGTAEAFKSLESGQNFELGFDFTNGLAFEDGAKSKSLYEHFKAGGVIIYPLMLLAVLCLLTGIYKTLQLYTMRSEYDELVTRLISLIQGGDLAGATSYVESLQSPARRVLQEALKNHQQSRTNLEEVLHESILAQVPKLDRFLSVLSVSASAAPLLGLLGTVMGIIKTFEMMAVYGTGEAKLMAGGISEALVTTEAGLMVAIPALVWYAVLNRRLKSIVANLERAMLGFINNVVPLEER